VIRGLAIAAVVVASAGCKVKDPPPVTEVWADDFTRSEVGRNYFPTSNNYKIEKGALKTQGGYNHPLWLRKKLPRDVQVDFDAWSNTKDGDIKVELFGDGRSHAANRGAYMASGYVFIMGGWSNRKSIIARRNEHGAAGKDIVQRALPKVVTGRKYHWRIKRQGDRVTWWVDDMEKPFLEYVDQAPLEGPGHEYFAFSNWESDSWFDNLKITPL
jgi:hypothetical protein